MELYPDTLARAIEKYVECNRNACARQIEGQMKRDGSDSEFCRSSRLGSVLQGVFLFVLLLCLLGVSARFFLGPMFEERATRASWLIGAAVWAISGCCGVLYMRHRAQKGRVRTVADDYPRG